MYDGAPAHFSRAVQDALNSIYHNRRTGRGGPIAWPPRCPNLNPLDFYLWGHRKTLVYAAPVDNEEAFHHRIVNACQTIRNYPSIFKRMGQSIMRRVENLILFYKCALSNITHKLNVSGNMFSSFGAWNSCSKFVCIFQLHHVQQLRVHGRWS
jgi:hypothetical protein